MSPAEYEITVQNEKTHKETVHPEQMLEDLKMTGLPERHHKINTLKTTKDIKGLISMRKDLKKIQTDF